jgi:hypothetical protein
MKYKKIGKAIGDLIEAYEIAIHTKEVHKPISFALYQTWRKWNEKEESRLKQVDSKEE